MNVQTKKSTQIVQGVLTGIGLWIFGHLLSGRLSFVEDIVFYRTGPLIFAFPIVFAVVCISVAKHSVKNGRSVYYKTSVICFSMPVFCFVLARLLSSIIELKIPVVSFIADIMQIVFILPCVAVFSIYTQLLTVIGTDTDGMKLVLILAAYFLPMLAGIIISLLIYKRRCGIWQKTDLFDERKSLR